MKQTKSQKQCKPHEPTLSYMESLLTVQHPPIGSIDSLSLE